MNRIEYLDNLCVETRSLFSVNFEVEVSGGERVRKGVENNLPEIHVTALVTGYTLICPRGNLSALNANPSSPFRSFFCSPVLFLLPLSPQQCHLSPPNPAVAQNREVPREF